MATCKVLVVAGGGGGGDSATYVGGGGGGGGLIYDDSFTLEAGLYNVVVGAGGSGNDSGSGSQGGDGGNSSFDSLVAIGGGGGGADSANGRNGGSGGGCGGNSGNTTIGGTGTVDQGNNGKSNFNGGGGGGAGGLPSNGTGGIGLTYDISGTNVTYSAGGSTTSSPSGSSGTPNTGTGGDAGNPSYNGGSGIVIIRYTTADFSAYSIRGGTKTTSGSDTIHTFTSSGQLIVALLTSPKITSIEAWGAGGTAVDTPSDRGAGGGGGGAYASISNLYLDPLTEYTIPITVGSASDSDFGGIVKAVKGSNSQFGIPYAGGQGGQASACIGDVVFSGGNGGNGNNTYDTGAGGGGAAGPDGDGQSATSPSGSTPTDGAAGDDGLGGAGGTSVTLVGEDDSLGGGGGRGSADGTAGNDGGFPGGGAGGGNGGIAYGGDGVVVIKYVTTSFGTCTGGTKTVDGIYTIHTFTSSGDFVVPAVSLPTVTTQAVSSIGTNTATANGNITSTGGNLNDIRGVVYSTTSHSAPGNVAPSSSGYESKVEETVGSYGTGAFTESLAGLTSRQTYYVRAYSHNVAGYSYGSEVSFTCLGFTNPANIYASDNTYTTLAAISGVLTVEVSKDAGVNWQTPKTVTFTSSDSVQTCGNGSTELWGSTFTRADMVDANFRIRLSHNGISQVYKTFGFTTGTDILTGLEVAIEGKYASSTLSLDHLKVRIYYGTSVLPVQAGSQAFASNGRKAGEGVGAGTGVLVFYDGSNWIACDSGGIVAA
jgi:hypothetical protein